jgi:hypothetical protein
MDVAKEISKSLSERLVIAKVLTSLGTGESYILNL